jgi:hypothetical protein
LEKFESGYPGSTSIASQNQRDGVPERFVDFVPAITSAGSLLGRITSIGPFETSSNNFVDRFPIGVRTTATDWHPAQQQQQQQRPRGTQL